ncbi:MULTISPECIES: RagB/SusD family nutrient uptake outer membrane protein [Olivibacter]|uniref:RagB/SusD family nutrient uptake outer membrane protein n=1 Tax=Olivibacter jilunii TaxID=985016 RepID=A0ABW6B917_9SPHI|nr:RagB/SusD family nutrient uptake outer membrane protein [Pseudosphingobacterium sp.]
MKAKLSISVLLLLCMQACKKDFLDETPRSVLNPVTFYVDETALNAGLNAAYADLRPIYGENEEPFRLTILGTDIYTHGKGTQGLPFNIYDPDLNAFSSEVNFIWSNCYKIINVCNTVNASAENIDMDEQKKLQIVAEARFIRALAYYWLVQQFGDVPLKLNPTVTVETEAERTPTPQVYEAMIADLVFATEHLAPSSSQWGRARKGAAQHLLSKVYLLTHDWENAARYAQIVINDKTNYALEPVFSRIFHHENQENKEIIFSVQFENDPTNSGNNGNRTHLYFQNSYSDIPGMTRVLQWGRPFSRYAPTAYLMSLYDDERDQRSDIWRTFDDYYYNFEATLPAGKSVGDPVDESWRNKIEFHPTLLKYWDPTRPTVNEERGNKDFIVFRLAETYLIAAEALMMAGKTNDAVSYFNEVRKRASRTGYNLSINPSDLNIDVILEERARELAGEMHRWFDLVRTGKALERIRAYSAAGQQIQPYHLLRPIPQTQIDLLTVPFAQNPNY